MTKRLHELLEDPGRLVEVAPAEAALILVELAALQSGLAARLATGPAQATEQPAPLKPRELTVDEAAERSGKSRRWVLDHWRRKMPFGKKRGKTVLFPETEFERWLKRP